MSTRSDVAIAVSKNVELTDVAKNILKNCDKEIKIEEGVLYLFECVKWDSSYELAQEFRSQECNDWEIREACLDHPEDESGDYGCWNDCPWDIKICRKVEINIGSKTLNETLCEEDETCN